MSKIDKAAEAWRAWCETLTVAAAAVLAKSPPDALPVERKPPIDDEDVEAFMVLREQLTPAACEAMTNLTNAQIAPEEMVEQTMARYGLVEAVDADWARLRIFRTAKGLAERIGQLEGEDAILWAFFGIPLQFTKGPQRYLLLPDGVTAQMIPMYEGGPTRTVAADLLADVQIEEEGYVGPPEFLNTRVIVQNLEVPAKVVKATDANGDKDSEEDEEDDDA